MPLTTLVVSIDGVAPRYVDQSTMPALCRLGLAGASTYAARTVRPAVTLPAHTSLLRGVDVSVHGIRDNTPLPLEGVAPSFLAEARRSGHETSAALNWTQIDQVIERDATTHRYLIDGGYDPGEDDAIVEFVRARPPAGDAVAFVYLCSPDLAGHDHGWGSAPYLAALRSSDRRLQRLVDAIADDVAVIVTTDHGGHEKTHGSDPSDETIFMTLRAPGIDAASTWGRSVTILDVAPTVAALAGFAAHPSWQGQSLTEGLEPIVDQLTASLSSMADETYGERVTMLEHSLQTAALLAERGATDDLVLAGLLHDIGHLAGNAGRWGRPGHADDGAVHLQAWLPASIVEPIRAHVDAKRWLVANDASYRSQLSEASLQTLRQQGGPFSDAETERFAAQPHFEDAIQLRRADDDGKTPERGVPTLDEWRPLLSAALTRATPPAAWLRDSCRCPECRDGHSGQRLLGPEALTRWWVAGRRADRWLLRHPVHGEHLVQTDDHDVPQPARRPLTPALARHAVATGLDGFRRDLVETGLGLGTGLGSRPGAVLELAESLGHVRTTNYGASFDVRNEPAASNLAYTTLGLALHTDNPYRDPVPTVQLLHCLVAAPTGGESRFVDGFAVADELRNDAPDAFDLLARVPVTFEYRSADTVLRAERPVIECHESGRVTAVSINHRSMQPGPAQADDPRWYEAYLQFVAMIDATRHALDIHLQAGDVVAFDNRRVLHARTAFSTEHARHLQGCYLDIDAVRSAVALTQV